MLREERETTGVNDSVVTGKRSLIEVWKNV